MRNGLIALLAALSLFAAPRAASAVEAIEGCTGAITKATAERLFAALNKPLPAGTPCKFEGVTTDVNMMEVVWSVAGKNLPSTKVIPRRCIESAKASGVTITASTTDTSGEFIAEIPAEIRTSCPGVVPLLADFTTVLSHERVVEAGKRYRPASPKSHMKMYVLYGVLLAAAIAIAIREFTRKRES